MKATEKDIVLGATLYYVHCVKAQLAKDAKLSCKITVTSEVNTNNNINHKWFLCDDDYRPYGYDWHHVKSHHFINDCGVGEIRYNLHRLFTTEEAALAYVEECKSGVFSDSLDQAVYDNDLKNADDDEYDYIQEKEEDDMTNNQKRLDWVRLHSQ